ncbi:MAG: alanine racemase [Ruminococcaceae bacterium]|nr:alanine racemase [Oscillospiraceae bacterium]
MKHKNTAYIDGDALISNYKTIDGITGDGVRTICVVKADAYGHNIGFSADLLGSAGCDFFAVSSEEEAVELRAIEEKNSRHPEILILGHIDPDNVAEMIEHDVICTAVSYENALELADSAKKCGGVLKIHIKLDTGMNRLGFPTSDGDFEKSAAQIESISVNENLGICGIFTHFSVADDELLDGKIVCGYEDVGGYTMLQLSRFKKMVDVLESRGIDVGVRHAANSAAILALPESYFDAVRAGVILYGMMPNGAIDARFRPVMRFESTVVHLHTVRRGEKISYGADFEAERDMVIATIGAGYGDGFARGYAGCTIEIGGVKCSQVGRICMDQFMVDVTGTPVSAGDAVTLFGGDNGESINELARLGNTINYEVTCRVSKRVRRVLK